MTTRGAFALPIVNATAIGAGAALHLAGSPEVGDAVWAVAILVMLAPLTVSVLRRLARGDLGVDAIALLAMVGALALGELLAGAVIALMLSGGSALEAAAGERARRELTALLKRAPTIAHRREGEAVREVPIDDVAPGEVVIVRAGEVVPVDGLVASEGAVLDESALTGEPLPVSRGRGGAVRSGSTNAGEAFDLRASRPASESVYAGVIRLVTEAERERAPLVRLADRYAAVFLPVTLAVAGGAWAVSGDAVRALAVLVVATPCPLILAAPIALLSGVSRAARRGVVVKGGQAIEGLGRARTVLLDKTGTLTLGAPRIETVIASDGVAPAELLRLAASVDQLSAHVLAEALVHEAERRGMELASPRRVTERPGEGIEGEVLGHRVTVGSAGWLGDRGCGGTQELQASLGRVAAPGRARILVALDSAPAGAIVMADRVRPDARATIDAMRAAGAARVAMVTGDRQEVAEEIGRELGLDAVYAERSAAEKLAVVRAVEDEPGRRPVIFVGDGVNDAPALAGADVGIAMGAAGATASAEAADVVIMVDRLDRVTAALAIGRRSLALARQSVLAGMGLSLAAMGVAALGYLPPVGGALLQEGIDVAVILNALRALRPGPSE